MSAVGQIFLLVGAVEKKTYIRQCRVHMHYLVFHGHKENRKLDIATSGKQRRIAANSSDMFYLHIRVVAFTVSALPRPTSTLTPLREPHEKKGIKTLNARPRYMSHKKLGFPSCRYHGGEFNAREALAGIRHSEGLGYSIYLADASPSRIEEPARRAPHGICNVRVVGRIGC
jgi:hypothetical protein